MALASPIPLITLNLIYWFNLKEKILAPVFILIILIVIEFLYFYYLIKIKEGKFEIEEIRDYWKEVNKLAFVIPLYVVIAVSAAIMVYGFLTSEYLLAFIFAIIGGILCVICAFVSKRNRTGFIIKKNGRIYLIKWK